MTSSRSIVLTLCFLCCYPLFAAASEDACENSAMMTCGNIDASFITTECQAKECLNLLESDDNIPLPVVLESTCSDSVPVYTFICTLHGNSLIWYINNETVTSFMPFDPLGRNISLTYPKNSPDPIYNVSATLTHVSKMPNRSSIPVCVSILTVQPFNESNLEDVPFSVFCQGSCQPQGPDHNNPDPMCQSKHYKVAATPSKPTEVTGGIIYTGDSQGNSVVSIKWLPPENDLNEVTVNYYVLTLSGPNTNSTTVQVDAAASLPYYLKVPHDDYTITVTAVDECGKISKKSQTMLNDFSENSPYTSVDPCIMIERQKDDINNRAHSFTVGFSVVLVIAVALGIAALVLSVLLFNERRSRRGSMS